MKRYRLVLVKGQFFDSGSSPQWRHGNSLHASMLITKPLEGSQPCWGTRRVTIFPSPFPDSRPGQSAVFAPWRMKFQTDPEELGRQGLQYRLLRLLLQIWKTRLIGR